MSCGPCEPTKCSDIAEGDEEYEALTDLYKRLFEDLDDDFCPVSAADAGDSAGGGGVKTDCGCPPTPLPGTVPSSSGKPSGAAANIVPDYCLDGIAADQSSQLKQADRQLTALLKRRKEYGGAISAAAAEGDVKHLIARLPAFKACRTRKPGSMNSTLFGLELEHGMSSATGGDGRDLDVKRAAYDLAAAEAYCKYPGAVEAAEMAVQVEPAGYLAEVAARFGAESYTGVGLDAGGSRQDESGNESPVVVVAYVGHTTPDGGDGSGDSKQNTSC